MKTPALDTPAFTLGEGSVTRESTTKRTLLRFTAPSKRLIDGGFSVSVHAVLLDAQGRFITRRSGASTERTVISTRASWEHEVDNDKLAAATQVVYMIDNRFDYRRKLLGGELPPLPAEADGSDFWRWLALDARALEDRAIKLDLTLWARDSSLEITHTQTPKLVTDNCRTEFELDLLDADQQIVFAKTFSTSMTGGRPAFDDSSISMDRRILRTLRFFELRGRTEVRGITPLTVPISAVSPG